MPSSQSIHRRLERLARDRWARHGVRTLLQAAWMALSIVCFGLGLQLLTGWPIPTDIVLALALVIVALGASQLLRRRMSPDEVARRIDKRFGLSQQLTTALEVSAQGQTEGVATYLLDNANYTTGQVQRYVKAHQRAPWTELLTVLALALLTIGLFLFLNINASANLPTAESVPPLSAPPAGAPNSAMPPDQPPGVPGGEGNTTGLAGQQPGTLSGESQQAAQALADALRDQSATRPAADQLDQGNTAGAAQSLRELADQASGLSEAARRDLAEQLNEAAGDIGNFDPELADQVRESAQGLQQEGDSAAQALESLADAVEQLGESSGEQSAQNESGQGESQQQQDGQQGRLAVVPHPARAMCPVSSANANSPPNV
ncbi:MAG: hypothetical protein HC876_03620 [Chloroflexaceae bacterium]|nr:hypothetical protein [Chloroflexaceae bacterium]